MLGLASQTSPAWTERALQDMDEVLLDHAHCEKKAASTALNLIFRYAYRPELMRPLSELAREELSHFELVLEIMRARDIPFERLRPAPYAGRLMSIVPVDEPLRLQDTLLCCAVIEARSCERMKLLAEHLEDPELKKLYQGLLACEARHHTTYVDLAARIFPEAQVMARLAEVAEHEAEVLAGAPTEPRLHNA